MVEKYMKIFSCVVFLYTLCQNAFAKTDSNNVMPSDVLVIIRNMHFERSILKAQKIKDSIMQAANALDKTGMEVLMMHEDWFQYGSWTILPIINRIHKKYGSSKKWIYFCEDTTQVDLKGLLKVLGRFQEGKNWFLGHGLHDSEPSIIHHFAFHNDLKSFKFPDFDAGWALSMPLVNELKERLESNPPDYGFSIDVKHEVAKFIYNDGKGTRLTNVPQFCINSALKKDHCVSTVAKEIPDCGLVDENEIFIAVKTCKKFHDERVPVVKKTVGKHAKHIRYYSDVADESIPTEYIDVGNTERGHCQKLHNIIKRSTDEEWRDKEWLVVIDDDTIMSYDRLRRHLACYESKKPVLLGERYAYALNFRKAGYEYPTGGGGMIMNRAAINELIKSGCKCYKADEPDDMWLGNCFNRMQIPMVHSNSLHQARPSQYTKEFLSHRFLVSFHKHHMVDPMQVYQDYLQAGGEDPNVQSEKEEL
ncbi:beta-1,3-glucosyltransferase-like [Clytia hemisphaerica]|uniref:Fringe-like glycosyltransferase domain-containing protein n=1 Tax=Clytia hemisphaerica TaxID=252671 RepID=A0A7M5VAS9_9CNID|eukprot:TCONS_00020575-protein